MELAQLAAASPGALQDRFATVPALVLRSTAPAGGLVKALSETLADDDIPQWAELYRGDSAVIPLAKSARNPFAGVVTVGRREDNDVLLEGAKISKFHALFRRGQFGWHLQDKGSTNGSFHNQRRLDPNEEVEVASGDEVRFGDSHGVFADLEMLETLCAYVRSQG